jgi:NTP pyrophosphatase (non-canonical NTP hydrolase)
MKTLNAIGREANEINAGNGWDVFAPGLFPGKPEAGMIGETNEQEKVRFLCTHMALVHSEVSEATEAIRHRDRENFDEELADIVIRVASIAHGLGTDLQSVIAAKLAKNRTRGLLHGGKAV